MLYDGCDDLAKTRTRAFRLSSLVRSQGLSNPCQFLLVAPEGQQVSSEIIAAHTAWIEGSKEIDELMLMTMEPEIQQNMENLHAHEMLLELKTLFAQQAEQELIQTTQDFHSCKQKERQSVSSYVLKMKGYIDNLERLGHPVTLGLAQAEQELIQTTQDFHSCKQKERQSVSSKSHLKELAIQGLRASRKLKLRALILYVGNGQREAIEAIGLFYLCLPSGLEIVLNNCHYALFITRGQAEQELIQTTRDFHSCKQKEGQSVSSYVLKMKGYIDNLERLGHPVTLGLATDVDGAVHTYKARLVVNGYTQTPRIDYEETFSPVADIRANRILIAIAAFYDYEIWQMDVKTVFLNGYLFEEVYMEQPEGFVNPKYPNQVRKFVSGLGVVLTIEEPISMYCDNTGAITIANKSGITKDARHFRVKVHYLREVIEYYDVKLEKVHTNDNLADPFTKALAFLKHSEHTKNIGMLQASSLM
nr:zinc finger, CCHC-type [Tanacetum cinerariifolium]